MTDAMTSAEWHPLAWELAKRADLAAGEGGEPHVCAWIRLLGKNEIVRGCGATSTEAMQALARKLTHMADIGVFSEPPDKTQFVLRDCPTTRAR